MEDFLKVIHFQTLYPNFNFVGFSFRNTGKKKQNTNTQNHKKLTAGYKGNIQDDFNYLLCFFLKEVLLLSISSLTFLSHGYNVFHGI